VVPTSGVEQPLDAVRRPLSEVLGHLPAILALDRTEQAEEVATDPRPEIGAGEARGDMRVQLLERISPSLDALDLLSLLRPVVHLSSASHFTSMWDNILLQEVRL
jgi:hypothetical protein